MISERVVSSLMVLSMLVLTSLTVIGHAQFGGACVGNSGISEPVNNSCPSPCKPSGIVPDDMIAGADGDLIYSMTSMTVNCSGTTATGKGACNLYSFSVSTLTVNNVNCGVCPDVCNTNCTSYNADSCNSSCSLPKGLTKSRATLAVNHSQKNDSRSSIYNSINVSATAQRGFGKSAFSHSPLYHRHLLIVGVSASALSHHAG